MYPLKSYEKIKRGYRFGVPTFYSDFHLGTDFIVPVGTPLYAPIDLEITGTQVGSEGGNTAFVKFPGRKEMMRSLHLRELPKKGIYKQGTVFAYTGNTGLSTGPHWHVDVSKNGTLNLNDKKNFTDPEPFFEELNKLEEDMKPTKDLAREYKALVGDDPGDNMNEGEQDKFAKKIKELREKPPTEIVVEKVVPATPEQVQEEAKNIFQRFLDSIFNK